MEFIGRGMEIALSTSPVRSSTERATRQPSSAPPKVETCAHPSSRSQPAIRADQGDYDEAREHFQAALRIHRELGNRRAAGPVLADLALLSARAGRFEEVGLGDDAGVREVGRRYRLRNALFYGRLKIDRTLEERRALVAALTLAALLFAVLAGGSYLDWFPLRGLVSEQYVGLGFAGCVSQAACSQSHQDSKGDATLDETLRSGAKR